MQQSTRISDIRIPALENPCMGFKQWTRTWIHCREYREFLYKFRVVDVLDEIEQPTQCTNFGAMDAMRKRTKSGNNMRIPVHDNTRSAPGDEGVARRGSSSKRKKKEASWTRRV